MEDLNTFGNALSGFFAAFFSSLTLCPTELIKCRLQAIRELEIEKAQELRKPIVSIIKIKKMIGVYKDFYTLQVKILKI